MNAQCDETISYSGVVWGAPRKRIFSWSVVLVSDCFACEECSCFQPWAKCQGFADPHQCRGKTLARGRLHVIKIGPFWKQPRHLYHEGRDDIPNVSYCRFEAMGWLAIFKRCAYIWKCLWSTCSVVQHISICNCDASSTYTTQRTIVTSKAQNAYLGQCNKIFWRYEVLL